MPDSTQLQSMALFIEQSRTVFEANPRAFDHSVNLMLKDGWVMNGPMLVCDGNLVVNMVKVNENFIGVALKVMDIQAQQLNEMFG